MGESYQVWSTAQSSDIKMRGYLEVRSTLPAKVNGGNLKGSWPAIWMLGSGNGHEWPRHGEIDIVEAVNGDPRIVMTMEAMANTRVTTLTTSSPTSPGPLSSQASSGTSGLTWVRLISLGG